jgi:hypothetical protein
MRVSTFWRFCEWEEVEDVKERITAMARANPATLNLVNLISFPFNFACAVQEAQRRGLSFDAPGSLRCKDVI